MSESRMSLEECRVLCVQAGKESQRSFDRAVLVGGALGISFLSVKDVLWSNLSVSPLFVATWFSFVVGILLLILSYGLSVKMCNRVIAAIDEQTDVLVEIKGVYARMTYLLTISSVVFLVAGFVYTAKILQVGL